MRDRVIPARGFAGSRPLPPRRSEPQTLPRRGTGIGQFANVELPPQDPTTAIVRNLFTSLLDLPTAARLAKPTGRRVFFGKAVVAPQRFAFHRVGAVNDPDAIKAGVQQASTARRTSSQTRGAPARGMPGVLGANY